MGDSIPARLSDGYSFLSYRVPGRACDVYWGSHGCDLEVGHAGWHICDPDDPWGGCGSPHGWTMYGDDVTPEDEAEYCIKNLPLMHYLASNDVVCYCKTCMPE